MGMIVVASSISHAQVMTLSPPCRTCSLGLGPTQALPGCYKRRHAAMFTLYIFCIVCMKESVGRHFEFVERLRTGIVAYQRKA